MKHTHTLDLKILYLTEVQPLALSCSSTYYILYGVVCECVGCARAQATLFLKFVDAAPPTGKVAAPRRVASQSHITRIRIHAPIQSTRSCVRARTHTQTHFWRSRCARMLLMCDDVPTPTAATLQHKRQTPAYYFDSNVFAPTSKYVLFDIALRH